MATIDINVVLGRTAAYEDENKKKDAPNRQTTNNLKEMGVSHNLVYLNFVLGFIPMPCNSAGIGTS